MGKAARLKAARQRLGIKFERRRTRGLTIPAQIPAACKKFRVLKTLHAPGGHFLASYTCPLIHAFGGHAEEKA